jgi:hypothetical protein
LVVAIASITILLAGGHLSKALASADESTCINGGCPRP